MRTRTSFEVEINFLTYFNIMESLVHMTLLFYYQNMHEIYIKNKYIVISLSFIRLNLMAGLTIFLNGHEKHRDWQVSGGNTTK
jgi:hypothetical protein